MAGTRPFPHLFDEGNDVLFYRIVGSSAGIEGQAVGKLFAADGCCRSSSNTDAWRGTMRSSFPFGIYIQSINRAGYMH